MSQIGEFSFVLATTAREGGLIDDHIFALVDEENTVGRLLAHEALTSLELGQDAGLACALAVRAPAVTATPKPDMP